MGIKITPALIAKMVIGDKLKDTEAPGLLVEVNRDGSKSFRYFRRMPADHGGRLVKMTLGSVTDFSLPDARVWASGLSNSLVRGVDPRDEIRAAREQREANETAAKVATAVEVMTVQRAYDHYIEQITLTHGKMTVAGKISRWNVAIGPAVATKALADVTHEDLQTIVERKLAAGFPSAANHLVADIKTMFRWFTRQGRSFTGLKVDPSADVYRLAAKVERDRVFNMRELRIFLRALADCDDSTRRFMSLLLLSGQRYDNVMTAKLGHWCVDTDAWEIETMKNGDANVVPLSAWGRSFFQQDGEFVFPSPKIAGQPCATNSGSISMKVRAKMDRIAGEELARWVPHDLRRVVSTHMARFGVDEKVVEAVLAHRPQGVKRIYNRWQYLSEKRLALALWEAEIIRLAVEEGVADKLGAPLPPEPPLLKIVA
jgi:integrase